MNNIQVLCEYHPVTDKIHEFTFHAGGREAIEQWKQRLQDVFQQHPRHHPETVLMLLDVRDCARMPMRYLFECLDDYRRLSAPLMPVRIACVCGPDARLMSLFKEFETMLSSSIQARFFDQDYAAARAWLLSD